MTAKNPFEYFHDAIGHRGVEIFKVLSEEEKKELQVDIMQNQKQNNETDEWLKSLNHYVPKDSTEESSIRYDIKCNLEKDSEFSYRIAEDYMRLGDIRKANEILSRVLRNNDLLNDEELISDEELERQNKQVRDRKRENCLRYENPFSAGLFPEIAKLGRALDRHVAAEDYESAAVVYDKIKFLDSERNKFCSQLESKLGKLKPKQEDKPEGKILYLVPADSEDPHKEIRQDLDLLCEVLDEPLFPHVDKLNREAEKTAEETRIFLDNLKKKHKK
ncbi:hypothetical protein GOV06_01330 [Candidatus Woesearchaeota archaeon]|nr:hypothetical protein [Candidatus Woesearchaeota archaeon]